MIRQRGSRRTIYLFRKVMDSVRIFCFVESVLLLKINKLRHIIINCVSVVLESQNKIFKLVLVVCEPHRKRLHNILNGQSCRQN